MAGQALFIIPFFIVGQPRPANQVDDLFQCRLVFSALSEEEAEKRTDETVVNEEQTYAETLQKTGPLAHFSVEVPASDKRAHTLDGRLTLAFLYCTLCLPHQHMLHTWTLYHQHLLYVPQGNCPLLSTIAPVGDIDVLSVLLYLSICARFCPTAWYAIWPIFFSTTYT